MKIGILGDIHGEEARLGSALGFFAAQNVGQVLSVGDVADGPGSLQACVNLLRQYSVLAVRGNHDDWFLRGLYRDWAGSHPINALDAEGRSWLDAQPLMRELETASGPLLLCHGVGGDFMRFLKPEDAGYAVESNQPLQDVLRGNRFRWMLNGHTHTRLIKRFGQLTNLNAGALGDSRESSVQGCEGGVWLADFEQRRAWLHFFAGSTLLEAGQQFELP